MDQLLQVVAAPKSPLSGLLSSGLQAALSPAIFGSCQCRLMIIGIALEGGSGGICSSVASGSTELM